MKLGWSGPRIPEEDQKPIIIALIFVMLLAMIGC